MDNFVDFSHVIGATSGEHSNMLGKFLYFSLSNVLVSRNCRNCAIVLAWSVLAGNGCPW